METLTSLLLGKATFSLKSLRQTYLPPFLGSTLRGAMGASLKKVGCPMQCEVPGKCIVRERCPYAYCFETSVPANSERFRNLQSIPHPYLIEPPDLHHDPWNESEIMDFSLVLIGRAIDYFPYFVVAIDTMAKNGLGRSRTPFELVNVTAQNSDQKTQKIWEKDSEIIQPLPPLKPASIKFRSNSDQVTVQFKTPLRIIEKKQIIDKNLSFRSFARALLSRLSSMLYFHCQTELDIDFKNLLKMAEAAKIVESDLAFKKVNRWSNRQRQKIPLDGLVGSVTWQGEAVRKLLPCIYAGQWVHIGKGAVFGLGKYKVIKNKKISE